MCCGTPPRPARSAGRRARRPRGGVLAPRRRRRRGARRRARPRARGRLRPARRRARHAIGGMGAVDRGRRRTGAAAADRASRERRRVPRRSTPEPGRAAGARGDAAPPGRRPRAPAGPDRRGRRADLRLRAAADGRAARRRRRGRARRMVDGAGRARARVRRHRRVRPGGATLATLGSSDVGAAVAAGLVLSATSIAAVVVYGCCVAGGSALLARLRPAPPAEDSARDRAEVRLAAVQVEGAEA